MPVSRGRTTKDKGGSKGKGKGGGRPKRGAYETVSAVVDKGLKQQIKNQNPIYGTMSAFVQAAIVRELQRNSPPDVNVPEDGVVYYKYERLSDLPRDKIAEFQALCDQQRHASEQLIATNASDDEIEAEGLAHMGVLKEWLINAGVRKSFVLTMFDHWDMSYRLEKFADQILPLAMELILLLRTYRFPGGDARRMAAEIAKIREDELWQATRWLDRDIGGMKSTLDQLITQTNDEGDRAAEEIRRDKPTQETATEAMEPKNSLLNRICGIFKP
ncbi:hypothetical protein [Agrobacterium tumefaciens]|uniref:hypothetical protein n=1 Tax=Agrobacterium tumefaciens TaxID=358 RepID=UPI0021D05A52|nr:hypothetical protein [Agrobacterium tumefaciens]UXS26944.1 hypothetical protein FY153_21015 [Agrobacterium tumefaciens]UXS54557.1 hypothetical protein FY148_17755 [Agrobacterium tumefaciens]UXS65470.1 hypothetical protein FY147_21440 [Agrobacterium tumefaciens]